MGSFARAPAFFSLPVCIDLTRVGPFHFSVAPVFSASLLQTS